MKQTFIQLFVLALFVVMISCKPQKSDGLKLVWQEEFDSEQIDWTKWSKVPRGNADWKNYMSDYDSLFAIRDGNLILRGIVNTTQKGDTAQFLTGGLQSQDKATFGVGRIEIRAKVTSAQGFWPAIWMLPNINKWPMGGEIDIMEHLNYDTIAYQTVHTNYTYNLKQRDPKPGTIHKIDPNEYNVYGLEKYQDSLCFFVNGTKTITYPRIDSLKDKGQYPFCDQEFYLILSAQLGGNWVGAVNPDQLPVEMAVDWVKFYEFE